jgi:hypothetical protein
MRLKAEFQIRIERFRGLAANDNHLGDGGFIFRNLATTELSYMPAIFTREEGAP